MPKHHSGHRMYPVKTPGWVKWLPGFYWPKPVSSMGVFLTFDDGPHPTITPALLQLLDNAGAKATFFCLGEQAQQYPALISEIIKRGHSIGNHGFSHLDGWKTKQSDYQAAVNQAVPFTSGKLFRPPYGRLSPMQLLSLWRQGYKVVLWDIMPGDFEENTTADQCIARISDHLQESNIIVLHENDKSLDRVLQITQATLELMKARNFTAEKIIP